MTYADALGWVFAITAVVLIVLGAYVFITGKGYNRHE